MTTLRCELGGHEWVRSGRGRPPKNCPEHQTPAQRQFAERHRAFYVPHPRQRNVDSVLDPTQDESPLGDTDV